MSVETTPSVPPPPQKRDNYVSKGLNIISQYKLLIYFQALLGVNRLYLLEGKRIINLLFYSYSLTSVVVSFYMIVVKNPTSTSYFILNQLIYIEYVALVINAAFFQKKRVISLFRNLASFDEMINISKDQPILSTIRIPTLCIIADVVHCVVEYIVLYIFCPVAIDEMTILLYLISLAQGCEHVYTTTLLRNISTRLSIVKAHVEKAFQHDKYVRMYTESNKVEVLSKNTELDITAMHRAYEKLHKCADRLNGIFNLPVFVLFLSSGISSIFLMKLAVSYLAVPGEDNLTKTLLVIVIIIWCIKYTIQVSIPCFFSSVTYRQVYDIRTMIHDALETIIFDKIERRKVKAFFQLTKDNEFAYALWGVIRLNMSLPLSYFSLCTTYLVIIIQFSKFID